MSKVRPPRKKQTLDIPSTTVKILKKEASPLMLKELHEIFNSLNEVKTPVSLSSLHNELNFDGRFVFLKNQGWILKTQAPEDDRNFLDDLDILEDDYEPSKEDYEWLDDDDDDEDDEDDDDELLVPFDDDDVEDDIDDVDVLDELDDLEPLEEIDELDELDELDDLDDLDDLEDDDFDELEEEKDPEY